MQVTDEEKKALLGGAGYFNDYVIKFPTVTITNETIHQESVSIKQAITGDGDLEFGGCIASTFEFEVSEVLLEELKGQEFTAELLVNNGDAARIKMGTYTAETVTQVDDNDYKKVVGYDAFYKMQDDVSDWYNSFFSNITQTTLKNFRQSLLLHFCVESEVQSLPNDNMIVTKTIDTTSNKITGQALLKMTCVLAGGFGIINRDGKFEIIYLTSEALYPEENLYPEETLYPEDGEFEYIGLNKDGTEIFYPEYRSVTYEEYNVERISCLILKTNKSSITATIGTDTSNPYIISGNYLLYGKTTEELNTIGNNIVNKFTSVVGYRPCDITTDGMAWLDIGSQIALEKKNDDIVAYLFSRELKGIQALTDTISAKGNKYRDNQTSVEDDIEDLKNKDDELDEKTDEISDSIDEVSGNLDDLAEKTTVSLKKTEESIEAEVTRAKGEESSLSSRITQTADAITAEVTRAKGEENNLSSRITITANSISSKVSKGDVCSEINQSSEQITLNSNRLVVNSTNFSLDSSGNGKIGGWHFGNGYMYSDGESFISTHSYTNYYQWNGYPYKSSLYQGKLICGVQSGSLSSGIPTTSYGYCDMSVAGFYSKDQDLSSGYLFAVDVGNSSVTTNTGAFTASDRRLKTNINEIDEQYANNLIDGLKPSTYRMIDGKRTHSGFIADEVKQTAEKVLGTAENFAAYATVKIDEDKQEYAALRYEEFIAPLTKYCQCLKRDLKQEIERNQQLQFQLLNLQGEFMILKQQVLGGK